MFTNKTIVIIGGTGSFGNTIVERLLKTDVREIRIFSRDEKKQDDMRSSLNNVKLKFYLGDVRDSVSTNDVMKGAHYVFHAGALKQVPACEFYPMQAVQTNILGSENVLNAAIANHVEKVVLLSTDKAVYPINAMGLSKAMMEKLMLAKARTIGESGTIFCTTRYGNIMASRGSVIPLFIKQLKEGKPLTITNPDMTRFLMNLDDSVDLVLHALSHAAQCDIFVQKSPACTMADLVQALKEILNLDSEIRYMGARHGEKVHETLIASEEIVKAQDLGRYYRVPADNRDINYENYSATANIFNKHLLEGYTSHNTVRLNVEEIKKLLLKLDIVKQELSSKQDRRNIVKLEQMRA